MVGLQRLSRVPRLTPIRPILAKNPGVPIGAKTWRYVGYKGGGEEGVVSFAWFLERRDGRAFVLSMVLNDTRHVVDQLSAVSAALGAIELLARS
jgi:hypothetical protein